MLELVAAGNDLHAGSAAIGALRTDHLDRVAGVTERAGDVLYVAPDAAVVGEVAGDLQDFHDHHLPTSLAASAYAPTVAAATLGHVMAATAAVAASDIARRREGLAAARAS